MKKIVFFVVAMVAVAACGNMKGDAKGSGSGTLVKDSVADSVLFGDGESQSEVRVRVVFPVGDDLVAKNIRDFIREQLDSKNSADSRDVRNMVRGYVEESKKEMTALHAKYEGPQKPGLSDFMDIDVLYEDEDFITMYVFSSVYTGGAHDSHFVRGVTFSKKDVAKVGVEILSRDKIGDIRKAVDDGITDYLRKYFDGNYDKADNPALEGKDGKPAIAELPQEGLYIQGDSVVFQYQDYEVGPYAFGRPCVKLSLGDMKKKGWLSEDFAKKVK